MDRRKKRIYYVARELEALFCGPNPPIKRMEFVAFYVDFLLSTLSTKDRRTLERIYLDTDENENPYF